MFLREYLYVDLDKVSGLASQLYDGVPEKATNVTARQKRVEADLKLLRGSSGSTSEDAVERRLGDSLFKDLETDLEAIGLLQDVSEALSRPSTWGSIEKLVRAGRIFRITSPGTLFHPAQMSDAILGLATAAHGLADLGVGSAASSNVTPTPPRAKSDTQKKAERAARMSPQGSSEPRFPEDLLPLGDSVPIMDIPRSQLGGMIQVVRGVFGEGLHLHLRPAGPEGPIVSARLEQGRRFLDSSPEVLFSRYGLSEQEWTVVGIVGQLGNRTVADENFNIMNSDGSVNRAKFVDLVANFLDQTVGLVDLPRAPGFSIVPLALYRAIGDSIEAAS